MLILVLILFFIFLLNYNKNFNLNLIFIGTFILLLLLSYNNNINEYMNNTNKLSTKLNNEKYYLSLKNSDISCDKCINNIAILDKIAKPVEIRIIDPNNQKKKIYIDNNILFSNNNMNNNINNLCAESKYLNPKNAEVEIIKVNEGMKIKFDDKNYIIKCNINSCNDDKIKLCVGTENDALIWTEE